MKAVPNGEPIRPTKARFGISARVVLKFKKSLNAKVVTVHDKMQKKYRYRLTEPLGKNFDPRFKPELTPKQMLKLGVFGGKYMTDCGPEDPRGWFQW